MKSLFHFIKLNNQTAGIHKICYAHTYAWDWLNSDFQIYQFDAVPRALYKGHGNKAKQYRRMIDIDNVNVTIGNELNKFN